MLLSVLLLRNRYDDFFERRTFLGASSFHSENVVIIGTRLEHSRSGPNYSAVSLLPGLRNPHPLLPVLEGLYNLIQSRLQSDASAGSKDNADCLLSVIVQRARHAKRIVYGLAYNVGDLTRC